MSLAAVRRTVRLSAHARAAARRFYATETVASPPTTVAVPAAPRRPSSFSGGIVGFLFGFSVASSYAAYHLLDEYQAASAALQASVAELKLSTENIATHVRRIEAVEKDLKALSDSAASKEDVSKLRAESKKLYDGLHVEFLDLRSHVWGIQQDVHSLSKRNNTNVRV